MSRSKVFFWLLASCLLASHLLLNPVHAATFDPSPDWKTIRTPHFLIHFPERITSAAQDAARILEEVHAAMSPKLEWKPWLETEVVLVDSTDEANGLTTVIPYNWIILYVSQPMPDSSLANYDNWLRTLITHEYTHLLHFDANRLIWKPFRVFLGKTVAPAGITPGWIREGFAVYEESAETTGGRNKYSYSDMLLRAAILDGNFPSIDEADGVGWRWPSYNLSYIFGGKFVDYLVETYGWDKFLEFNKRVQGSILLTMVNHHARNVYHKTFYELWREWKRTLEEKYSGLKSKLEQEGLTPKDEVVLPAWEDQFKSAVPSPDSAKLAYIAASPHHATEIRILDLETGEDKKIAKSDANKLAWSRDGGKIAYSAIGSYKRYNRYYDLWIYDVEKKKSKRLTSGKRARDPDFSPFSEEIVFVSSDAGTDRVGIIDLKSKKTTMITEDVKYAHYADPKFSPDGNRIALNEFTQKDGWKIYVMSKDGKNKKRLTSGRGMETSPWWTPDGRHVLYASDETGIANIYRTNVETGKTERLSNVLTGFYEPATVDGSKIFVRDYNSKGFYISSFNAQPAGPPAKIPKKKDKGEKAGKNTDPEPEVQSGADGENLPDPESVELEYKPEKYCPLGKSLLLPRFISPYATYIEGAFFFSLLTAGMDPLRWHNWMGGITYRTDAKYLGYFGRYWYNRWLPVIGAGINDYAVDFGDVTFVYDTGERRTTHYYEERRNAHAFLSVPIKRSNFTISYFYEDRMPVTFLYPAEKQALNLGIFSGFNGQFLYNDTERYPASISPENGRMIKLNGYISDEVFGSGGNNEQIVFAGDWREYIRLWHHHVLGLRAAGGMTWGDRQVQGTFGLGGDVGEGNLAQGGSYNYFPLRGIPVSALSRTRAMLLSAEYRFPIVSPQRGIGTWPISLNNLHGAVFADYGNAWNADEIRGGLHFFDEFLLGVGTELRGDFILGHGLPVTGRLGYAIIVVNRDRLGNLTAPIIGTDIKYGVLILQIGTSF
jgi:hypothetical protein